MKRRLHLNLFIYGRGHHEASWRHPQSSPRSLMDIDHYIDCSRTAEAAHFDSIFLADVLNLPPDVNTSARLWLEPLTALGAIAHATSRIGLIATASTSHTEPFNLARQFCSLDHISRGRVGWNIVTSFSIAGSRNFGGGGRLSHAGRYDKGEEFIKVVTGLWNSWSDAAVIDDRKTGTFLKKECVREISHKGHNFEVAGPLNLPRSPQGWPVLVQAGSSDTGKAFAARHAEAVFTAHIQKSTAKDFYSDLKARVVAAGRPADQLLVLPGISAMIGSTELEAKRLQRELDDMGDINVGLTRLSDRFDGYDFSNIKLDKVLVPEDFPDPAANESSRGRTELIVGAVKREPLTMRQLLAKLAGARGHFVMAGTPEQVADTIEDWVDSGAADGFNIMPPVLPWMLEVFAQEVVPILKRRRRFRTEYEGRTLREHFNLRRPQA
jgi:FMN-dependent oxidoreductase (nitrilotriacetate monooxygenase family)